jgi:adenylate cyclase
MNTESFKRKLTAIFSADVVGYSRLMGEDDAATVKTITAYREIMAALIKQHRGRMVDSPGDNVLAEFASVVDAAQCAVAVQKEFQARNADLPENRRMQFRIGVNLGDIIEEGERIYGDGVNIAARLEALADPGGICISKTAFEHIESKLPFGYEYIGKQTVKNITKPVGAYRVLMEPRISGVADEEEGEADMAKRRKPFLVGAVVLLFVIIGFGAWYFYLRSFPSAVEPASKERMAFPLPEKPSIAVLPFVNMSDDPNQDFFCDGITDQIITYLSMNPNMFVIARNSVFTYKGKPVKIQQVAEELGVRYVLEGSVQSVENRLRLTAQLIDALTGKLLWAERYDRDLKDIFALQDEITARILEELQVKLVFGEEYRRVGGPKNLDFIQKMSKGWSYFLLFTPESNAQARQMYEEAITIEPEAANAYDMLGWTHLFEVIFGVSKSPGKDMERAFELAQKAITLNDSVGSPHSLLGYIYLAKRQYEKAVAEVEQAVALSPNDADARAHMANIFNYVGKREESINLSKQAIRLNPFPQSYYFTFLGEALCLAGQYEEAIKAYKKALHLNPKDSLSKPGLAVAYSLLGREEEARAMAAEFLMIRPRFSVKRWEMGIPYKNRADITLFADTMRKVGLPD